MYFDVLSGKESKDLSQKRFVFRLLDIDEARGLSTMSINGGVDHESSEFRIAIPADLEVGDVVAVSYSRKQTRARGLKHPPVVWGTFDGIVTQIVGQPPAQLKVRFSWSDAAPQDGIIDLARGIDTPENVAVNSVSRSSQSRTTLEKWDQEYKEAELDSSTEDGPSHFVRVSELFGKTP